jgi:hypothetical protein
VLHFSSGILVNPQFADVAAVSFDIGERQAAVVHTAGTGVSKIYKKDPDFSVCWKSLLANRSSPAPGASRRGP